MNLQMLKKAMISYVTNMGKAIWSAIAHPLTIKGKKSGNLIGYRMYGNSEQSGTPTPSSPEEISSVGKLTTKNILDVESVWSEYANVEGGITFDRSNIPTNSAIVNCKENTQYTFSAEYQFIDNSGGGPYILFRYTDGYTSSVSIGGEKGTVFLTSTKDRTISEIVLVKGLGVYSGLKLTNMQLEEGTVATEYEPYQKYKIPVKVSGLGKEETVDIYLDEPLRKVGDYEDEIDFEKRQVIRRIYHERITKITTQGDTNRYLTTIQKRPYVKEGVAHCLSTKFKPGNVRYAQIMQTMNIIKTYRTGAGANSVVYSLKSSTLADAQAEIGDGFEVCYVLYTPITENIELPPIPQFNGTTTYEVQTDTPPSGIEVCYYG